jgi:hypothetical protein
MQDSYRACECRVNPSPSVTVTVFRELLIFTVFNLSPAHRIYQYCGHDEFVTYYWKCFSNCNPCTLQNVQLSGNRKHSAVPVEEWRGHANDACNARRRAPLGQTLPIPRTITDTNPTPNTKPMQWQTKYTVRNTFNPGNINITHPIAEFPKQDETWNVVSVHSNSHRGQFAHASVNGYSGRSIIS